VGVARLFHSFSHRANKVIAYGVDPEEARARNCQSFK